MLTKLLHDNFMATNVQVFLLQRLETFQTNRTLEPRLAVFLVLFHGATHQVAAHSACLHLPPERSELSMHQPQMESEPV